MGDIESRKCFVNSRTVLRIRLGNDTDTNVEKIVVELKQGPRPFAAKPRRYPPTGREFMERYVDRVIKYGFGKFSSNSQCIAAPVLVEKPPTNRF